MILPLQEREHEILKPRCSDWTGAAGEESLKSLEAIAERFQNVDHYLVNCIVSIV
ncbi:unnamed protein product [Leptidea sinapis]|uniref:Uncharacterized protein n=1 Tax=Leptidea sinapis TaxID=189913 RepID=A0A5E4QAX7_9NEOP|nr:unnamed protein product [Leptidea sinapis]